MAALLPTFQGRGEAGDRAAAEADWTRARSLNPLEDCLRRETELWVTQKAKETASPKAGPHPAGHPPRGGRDRRRYASGPDRPEGGRRRGALLRRLLASGGLADR